MDKDIKKQWVEALRSGEYEQTQGSLRVGERFCCLGVLCDLAVRAEVPGVSWTLHGEVMTFVRGQVQIDTMLPPLPVVDWAGLGFGNPPVATLASGRGTVRLELTLAELNDSGAPFGQIADLIEEQL